MLFLLPLMEVMFPAAVVAAVVAHNHIDAVPQALDLQEDIIHKAKQDESRKICMIQAARRYLHMDNMIRNCLIHWQENLISEYTLIRDRL